MAADFAQWTDRLIRRLAALHDWQQRIILFAQNISKLDPDEAALAFAQLLQIGICRNKKNAPIAVESAILALAFRQWPHEHLIRTREAAAALEDRLPGTFLSEIDVSLPEMGGELPVPDYSNGGRPLTLGERRSVASCPNRKLIEKAMRDPHPMVTTKLLRNPKLTENDVIFMASKRPVSTAVLVEIALHLRWRSSRRICHSLLFNPALTNGVKLTLMPGLDITILKEISCDENFSPLIKETATRIISYRKL